MDRRKFVISAISATLTGSGLAPTMAQAPARWSPSRPVRIVAGASGGILDIVARQLADKLQAELGQPVIVDNKAGGGGIVTMEAVKASAPDGHTIGITTFVEMAINPWIYERLPYDPLKDFAPASVIYSGQILLAAHPSFGRVPGRGVEV